MDAALGLWGAGGHRAQCGLVEGALMFIGILGRVRGLDRARISGLCKAFAECFEKQFGSLSCRELRPEGFSSDNQPHICEDLSRRAIRFTTRCLAGAFQADPGSPVHRA
jgi:hypothetical protein